MSLLLSTLYLPPNTVDVTVVDVDGDGQHEIVVAAKSALDVVPAPISLFVYRQTASSSWQRLKTIELGTEPIFWDVYQGVWGLDARGVVNLMTGERVVETDTWLAQLRNTSPKRGRFVMDLMYDGRLDFLIQGPQGVNIWNDTGGLQHQSLQTVDGSIREYKTTGGVQVEIAQRSQPLVVADVTGDRQQEIIWLQQQITQVESLSGRSWKSDLPINVEPQYAERPKRSLSWVTWVDVNNDQKTDLLWQYWIQGANWFGGSAEIGVSLSGEEGWGTPIVLHEDRAVMNMQLYDIDNDGDVEIWSTGVEMGIAALSKTLLSQSAKTRIQVYEMTTEGPRVEPLSTLDVAVPIGQEDAFDYRPISDQNVDGIVDIVLLRGTELSVWESSEGTWTLAESTALTHRGSFAQSCELTCSDAVFVIWGEGQSLATIVQGL